jgi:hypothetical protein
MPDVNALFWFGELYFCASCTCLIAWFCKLHQFGFTLKALLILWTITVSILFVSFWLIRFCSIQIVSVIFVFYLIGVKTHDPTYPRRTPPMQARAAQTSAGDWKLVYCASPRFYIKRFPGYGRDLVGSLLVAVLYRLYCCCVVDRHCFFSFCRIVACTVC